MTQSDYNQERTTTTQATELLEQETSKRLYLEDQLIHYKVWNLFLTIDNNSYASFLLQRISLEAVRLRDPHPLQFC